jgi:glycine cleavage system H protein
MSYPTELHYAKSHEWIQTSGQSATVGITQFAIEQLGDVVHLDLPKVGTKFKAQETFGTIESTKTVSDLYMPAGGTITEVNTALLDAPEAIAEDPYKKGWLIKFTLEGAPQGMLQAAEYEKYVQDESSH